MTRAQTRRVEALYRAYEGHHLSDGGEQLGFGTGPQPKPRTELALAACRSHLPTSGDLLDIGTGNGSVLKSAGTVLPKWRLHAFDVADTRKDEVLRIPHVLTFESGPLEAIPKGPFDAAVLWHVLEHTPHPLDLLRAIRGRLRPRGALLVQVPDVWKTPYDLAVIDHCSHFAKSGLLGLASAAGFSPVLDGEKLTHNCITLLMRPVEKRKGASRTRRRAAATRLCFQWLNRAVREMQQAARHGPYAIFGTGMAGIWLSTQLPHPPALFIDEDRRRAGKLIGKAPVVHPEDAPEDLPVVLAFTRNAAQRVRSRLLRRYPSSRRWKLILPPPGPGREGTGPALGVRHP
ncbi:MAG: class I SAM-dependent methyltransferase [Nitrospirae bacterium]|nr:class I SAM-dependent methyltransferase [Nitrospirota bacterium]